MTREKSHEARADWHALQATQFDAIDASLFKNSIAHHDGREQALRTGRDICDPDCKCRTEAEP